MSVREDSDPDLIGWIHPSLYTDQSPIQGRGLFTNALIEKGDLVVRWGGWLFVGTSASADSTLQEHTAVGISEGVVLGAVDPSAISPDDFMNHSCEPNVGMRDAISLVALRTISLGEELVADYVMWTADQHYEMDRSCNCRTARCRHSITGKDWLMPELQRRYGAYFSPFLRRRIAQEGPRKGEP